ncbi:MAG: hypothetical protein K2K45_03200 [Muribaculaceae bacterium]|nr:hypothetical protein [Muribaculaceae bacterium]
MESQIGWIDFSPKDRNRVKRFMDIMGMGGVVDELGIGMIRDAMSNKLFPGFSTLYTRAKYFFITPYILLEKEKKQTKRQSGMDYFHNAEVDTNRIIIRFYENHPERSGESYFGKDKKDGNLKRQPSEIYWNGMQHLHLLESEGSIDQILSDRHSLMDELLSSDRGDDPVKEQGENHMTICENVSYDSNWRQFITDNGLRLTRTEAETLRDRLQLHLKDSLPTSLVANSKLWTKYSSALEESRQSKYLDNAFIHFVESSIDLISNEELRKNLIKAHDMALFLHGAHIAYNIQLWSKVNARVDFIDKLRSEGIDWLCNLSDRMIDFDGFHIDDCIRGTNLKTPTRKFLNEIQILIKNNSDWIQIESELCSLTEHQERWNKKSKSRFVKIEKGQVIEEMNKQQWLGLYLINYRYMSTLSVIKDIYDGLANEV